MQELVLPNVRKIIIPDPGHVMFEADLKGADAQVVAWEAEDEDLKAAFRAGLDVHHKNGEDMLGSAFTNLKGHAYDAARQKNKVAVHLTNYGGTPAAIARSLGWTTHEGDRFQKRWFSLHPGIRTNFHERVRRNLESDRTIRNQFGFRRVFFDRIDNCFTEALAWIPQSTVAINTYVAALQVEREWFPDPTDVAGMLLQTHDSLNFQFRLSSAPLPDAIRSKLAVVTPYPDPLTIPWDLKRSTKSWGDMEKT
jgi:DNA polymerase-1